MEYIAALQRAYDADVGSIGVIPSVSVLASAHLVCQCTNANAAESRHVDVRGAHFARRSTYIEVETPRQPLAAWVATQFTVWYDAL